MQIVLNIEKKHVKTAMCVTAMVLFAWLVVWNVGISMPTKYVQWLQPIKMVLHQCPVYYDGMAGWFTVISVVTLSYLLWTVFMCFVCSPKGLSLKTATNYEHIIFSEVIAAMTLFHTLQIFDREEYTRKYKDLIPVIGQNPYLTPFAIGTIAVVCRMIIRLHSHRTTKREEFLLLLPYLMGAAIIFATRIPVIYRAIVKFLSPFQIQDAQLDYRIFYSYVKVLEVGLCLLCIIMIAQVRYFKKQNKI